jgi:hypothetical protein
MKTVKKFCSAAIIALVLLLCTKGNQIQTKQENLNQIGLKKHNPANCQVKVKSDNIVYWRIGRLGKSFPINAGQNIKNQRYVFISIM